MWKSVDVMYSMWTATKQLSAKQSAPVCLSPVQISSGIVMHVENQLSQHRLSKERFERICPVVRERRYAGGDELNLCFILEKAELTTK